MISAQAATRWKRAVDVPVSFRMSVNTPETGAIFANSSLIDDHFARCFDTAVHVPPAVLHSIDRQAHPSRVASHGQALSAGRPAPKQNHAAWRALARVEGDPKSHSPADELLTTDRRQVYGVQLHPRRRSRHGEEISGLRQSGWDDGQSRDFQQTPPFVALATGAPLAEAICEGLARDHLSSAVPAAARTEQMALWMRKIAEITLPDFIFSRQDRIGNIDDLPYWYWVEGGRVRRAPAAGSHSPEQIAGFTPGFIERTGMPERPRHNATGTHPRLIALDRDFDEHGRPLDCDKP